MKLSLFRFARPPSEAAAVTDLDVTPVMNLFIILIPFLVSMAVFTRLAIIEFSVPPNIGPGLSRTNEKPTPKLTLRLGEDYCGLVLGDTLLDSLPVTGGKYPFDILSERLKKRKNELAYGGEIIVASRDVVPFKHIVAAMDLCREAGLEKIGLSSATGTGTPQ